MAIDPQPWSGLLSGRRNDEVELSLRAVLGESEGGGSGSFPGEASDRERWYVKPQNHRQGGQVIVSEYVVSAVGQLIGAPVCRVEPIRVPSDLSGHQFSSGLVLEEGIASASQAVPHAVEDHGLLYRGRDDNSRRHAGVFALYDWCWGGDPQWLYSATDDNKLFSHDHGWYFPPEGASIETDQLRANVDSPHPLPLREDDLDQGELDRLADNLDAVRRSELEAVLALVPASWPASEECLETVGLFLEQRAPEVASRIRDIRAKLRGTP